MSRHTHVLPPPISEILETQYYLQYKNVRPEYLKQVCVRM